MQEKTGNWRHLAAKNWNVPQEVKKWKLGLTRELHSSAICRWKLNLFLVISSSSKFANTADKYKTTNIIQVAAQSQQSLTTIQIDLRDAFVNIWSKTFRAQFYQNPTKLLNIAINICLIKKLIKVLFTVHYILLLSSFAFQTLLIRVITFQIDIKRTLWPVTN